MPKQKLTDEFVENAENNKSYTVEYYDKEVSGLILRITKNNTKSFSYRYNLKGTGKRITFGRYPDLSLEEARIEALMAKKNVDKGFDPQVRMDMIKYNDKQKLEKMSKEIPSYLLLEDLTEKYKNLYLPKLKQSTQQSYKGYIKRNILPALGSIMINDISRKHILNLLDDIAYQQGHPSTANRIKVVLSSIFNFAIERELVNYNPVKGISKYKPTNGNGGRSRFYSEKEIKKIWEAIEGLTYDATVAFFKILFLTGQRRSETLKMKWKDIDFNNMIWSIPAEDAKNNTAHDIPLTEPIIQILEEMKEYSNCPFVFESPQSKYKGTHFTSTNSAVKSIKDNSGIDDFRIHDIRRTVATYLTKLGASREVLGKILNHKGLSKDSGVTAIYDRHSYSDEKRKALQTWNRRLMEIVS